MAFLRYLMLLALIVWIGGLFFFAFVRSPDGFLCFAVEASRGIVNWQHPQIAALDRNRLRCCIFYQLVALFPHAWWSFTAVCSA